MRREKVRYKHCVCRLGVGHTRHACLLGLSGNEAPLCPRCGAYLTVKHVLLSCPNLENERLRLFGLQCVMLTLRDLLGDESRYIGTICLFAFIAAAGLSVIYSLDS